MGRIRGWALSPVAVLAVVLIPVARGEEPRGGRVEVALECRPGMPPGGSGHQEGALSATPLAGVKVPPPGTRVHYGELRFTGGVRFLFAIDPPEELRGRATFYVDRNGDGDFGNDDPAGYPTESVGAVVVVDLPREGKGTYEYPIWLWTSLQGGTVTTGVAKPTFSYYAKCAKRGSLELTAEDTDVAFAVTVADGRNDGEFRSDRVHVDWNGNGKDERIEWLKVGDARFYRGAVIKLAKIHPFADSVVFEVAQAQEAPPGVPDVAADLKDELEVGKEPPPLDVADLDGRKISLAEYRGKVLLIDFWATWCGPCMREMPNVLATWLELHDRGFEVVGVSLDQDLAKLRETLAKEKIGWRQTCDGKKWQGELVRRYRVDGVPRAILVGRDGTIVSLFARGEALSRLVQEELAKGE